LSETNTIGYYPRWVLWGACLLLIVANVFNIGADLGGMADATTMITGVQALYWLPLYTLLMIVLLFWLSYRRIARIFKWLTLVLFAYVVAAFLAHPDWHAVLGATFVPRIEWSSGFLATCVGILGTTISPYLFFWQASQEVEHEREQGRRTVAQRQGATDAELRAARTDVCTGMLFLYRSTVFWTPSDLKLGCISQGTLLLMSHLGGCFVSMPPNQPGLIVLTLKLVQRQSEVLHRIKGLEP